MLLRAVPVCHDSLQAEAIRGADSDANSLAHAADSHAAKPWRVHFRILPSGSNPLAPSPSQCSQLATIPRYQ
jgi:hypothetical protein